MVEGLITSMILLGIVLSCIIIFRQKINQSSINLKVGLFSIVVAILGNIIGRFEFIEYFQLIGYLVQRIALIFLIMSIIITGYISIFKYIKGVTVKLSLLSLFLFMIFSVLANSYNMLNLESEFFMYMNLGKTISIIIIIMCILVKTFKLIFGKTSIGSKQA